METSVYKILNSPGIAACQELFSVKDLLEELSTKLNVELASHTFSHYCLEEGHIIEQLEENIKMVREYSVAYYTTIIFPRNQVSDKYLKICSGHGFTHYREVIEDSIRKAS